MRSACRKAAQGLLFAVMLVVAAAGTETRAQGGRAETSRTTNAAVVARGSSSKSSSRADSDQKGTVRREPRRGAQDVGEQGAKGSRSVRVNRSGASVGSRASSRSGANGNSASSRTKGSRSGRDAGVSGPRDVRDGKSRSGNISGRSSQRLDSRGVRSSRVGDRKPVRHTNHPAVRDYPPTRDRRPVRKIHGSSHIFVGVAWPWQTRYHRHWRPRYRYRQVVNVIVGWGGQRRAERVDVRTYYRHRVLYADARSAEIEIEIDAIELYQNNRHLGTVDRIPGAVGKVRATVYSDGTIDFDRNIFIVGDAFSGFEIIATRYYDDYLYNAYDSRDGYRVGRIDLRRGRVVMKKRSVLFNPSHFAGYAPISLLPDDERLWDFGRTEMDRHYRDDGAGWYRDYQDRGLYDDYELSRNLEVSYRTPQGAEIRMERSTVLDRLD